MLGGCTRDSKGMILREISLKKFDFNSKLSLKVGTAFRAPSLSLIPKPFALNTVTRSQSPLPPFKLLPHLVVLRNPCFCIPHLILATSEMKKCYIKP